MKRNNLDEEMNFDFIEATKFNSPGEVFPLKNLSLSSKRFDTNLNDSLGN